MRGKTITWGLLVAALPFAATADTGFYIGGSGGHRTTDIDRSVGRTTSAIEAIYTDAYPNQDPAAAPVLNFPPEIIDDRDDHDLGWKVFGGWAPHEYTFFEAGFMDLGENSVTLDITATFTPSAPPAPGVPVAPAPITETLSFVSDAKGPFVTGGIKYPVSSNIDVFGKVGVFLWDVDLDFAGTVNNIASAGQNLPGGDDGTSLLLGLGGRYKFTDMVSVRAEWEYIDDVFDEEVHLYSLGLELHFGN